MKVALVSSKLIREHKCSSMRPSHYLGRTAAKVYDVKRIAALIRRHEAGLAKAKADLVVAESRTEELKKSGLLIPLEPKCP